MRLAKNPSANVQLEQCASGTKLCLLMRQRRIARQLLQPLGPSHMVVCDCLRLYDADRAPLLCTVSIIRLACGSHTLQCSAVHICYWERNQRLLCKQHCAPAVEPRCHGGCRGVPPHVAVIPRPQRHQPPALSARLQPGRAHDVTAGGRMGPRLPAGGGCDDVRHAERPGLEWHLQESGGQAVGLQSLLYRDRQCDRVVGA